MNLDNLERQKYNKRILKLLKKIIEENPTQRFSQILYNYKMVISNMENNWADEYYLESKELYNRIKDKL